MIINRKPKQRTVFSLKRNKEETILIFEFRIIKMKRKRLQAYLKIVSLDNQQNASGIDVTYSQLG